MTTLLLTETTLFFHDVISRTEKPSGLVKVTNWTVALANQHALVDRAADEADKRAADEAKGPTAKPKTHGTRGHALTFGPGSKDWSSITRPPSRAATLTSVSSTAPTSSTPITNLNSEKSSEGKPTIAWAFGGLQDENEGSEDLASVLGKRGSTSVCGSTRMITPSYRFSSPLGGGQNRRI